MLSVFLPEQQITFSSVFILTEKQTRSSEKKEGDIFTLLAEIEMYDESMWTVFCLISICILGVA